MLRGFTHATRGMPRHNVGTPALCPTRGQAMGQATSCVAPAMATLDAHQRNVMKPRVFVKKNPGDFPA